MSPESVTQCLLEGHGWIRRQSPANQPFTPMQQAIGHGSALFAMLFGSVHSRKRPSPNGFHNVSDTLTYGFKQKFICAISPKKRFIAFTSSPVAVRRTTWLGSAAPLVAGISAAARGSIEGLGCRFKKERGRGTPNSSNPVCRPTHPAVPPAPHGHSRKSNRAPFPIFTLSADFSSTCYRRRAPRRRGRAARACNADSMPPTGAAPQTCDGAIPTWTHSGH